MAHWYVFRVSEAPLGPWTTEAVAEAILAGTLDPTTLVAAPGGSRWLRACDVPVVARVLEGSPTRRGAGRSAAAARAPDTHRTPPPEGPNATPITFVVAPSPVPALPYYGGGDTLESAGNESPRRLA